MPCFPVAIASLRPILVLQAMAENKKHVYDESKIKTLSSLEHIRLRTGMYIGRIGDGSHHDDGCYILLKEVMDNAIDEYIMGHGKEVQIDIEGNARQRARFRPRHPAGQGGGLRLQDQHRRQIQRRGVPIQRRPQRRRHQGGQRAVEGISGAQPSRRRIRRGGLQDRQTEEGEDRQDASEPDGTFIDSSRTRRFSRTASSGRNSSSAGCGITATSTPGLKLILQRRRPFQSRATA